MKNGSGMVVLVAALILLWSPVFGQNDGSAAGFTPAWQVGDHWILEATYRDQRQQGDVWLPPIQWVFKVRSMKVVEGRECYAIHVFPRQANVKQQAVLYLDSRNLRPVKVIDIFPVGNKIRHQVKDIDPSEPSPLSSEGSLIPYDLPVFPLERQSVQRADGYGGYSGPKARLFGRSKKLGGLSFRRQVSQKTQRPERQHSDTFAAYRSSGEAFQVELGETRSNRQITQLWQEGQPWSIAADSRECKVRLLQPSTATPLPNTDQGGSN